MNSFPLSPRQRNQIRQTFESLAEYSDSAVLLFYGRLFEIAPNLRPLFKIDIRVQARKLMDTLSTVVAALDNFEALHDQLTDLGRKHVGYGVQPQDYDTLRKALLWALGQALGPEFDRETKAAWNELLTAISTVMLEGAAQQTGA
jgi:hemoglobin-like flavoprotein